MRVFGSSRREAHRVEKEVYNSGKANTSLEPRHTGPKAVRLPHSIAGSRGANSVIGLSGKFYATFCVVSLGDLGTLLGAARRVASFAFGCTCD